MKGDTRSNFRLIKIGNKVLLLDNLKRAERKGDKVEFPFSGPYTMIEVYYKGLRVWLQNKEGRHSDANMHQI